MSEIIRVERWQSNAQPSGHWIIAPGQRPPAVLFREKEWTRLADGYIARDDLAKRRLDTLTLSPG